MLRTFRRVQTARINAVDDQVGRVEDVCFDDDAWTIRYLVVDTGNWLPGRKVLISPDSIKTPITEGDRIDLKLTRQQLQDSPPADEDSRLRSAANVAGYEIQASDGSIGHVQDFVFDDESWSIRYLVIDTVNWWPGGRKVLVSTRWIDHIDWAERAVDTSLGREAVKRSPEYDEGALLDRQYETALHEAHERAGYWE